MKRYISLGHDALQLLVSCFTLVMAAVVAIYMVFLFSTGVYHFLHEIPNIVGGVTLDGPDRISAADLVNIEEGMLHSIAFSLVLLKAFRILLYYSKTLHLNIKYLVEISIITPAIEILFNSGSYDIQTLLLFGFFGLGNLFVYVFCFETFKQIGIDEN